MRFLHTSDWHVGKALRGHSRMEEFAAALEDVYRIASDEKVDCVLISGDLYEHKLTAPEADKLIFETLARLASSKIAIVAIPGNHDSGIRWEALEPLLSPLGIHVVPRVVPPEEGSVVNVVSRNGAEAALVACVPFVPERYYGSARSLFQGSEKWAQEYQQGMGDLLDAMARAFTSETVNILMAHLYATAAALGGGEAERTVSFDYAVPPARIPTTAHYVALGHVHRPQQVPTAAPARYAGSLLQLDFGEIEQEKSVVIVEASPGKPARVRTVPISAGRRLVDLTGTLDELRTTDQPLGDAWVRATVRTDGPVPGIADVIKAIFPNAVHVTTDYPRLPEHGDDPSGLMTLRPRDQFASFYRSKHGSEPSPEVLAVFEEVYLAVEGEA
jgi:exonuclease SbcD